MRIGIFSLAYFPFVGGAEIAIKEITDRLPDADFPIFHHNFEKYGHGKLQKFLYIFRAWRAAENAHKEKPFQAIWAIMASYAGLAALLFKLRHPRVPMLLTLQEGDSEAHILHRVSIFYPFWKLIFKKADHVQVISSFLADFGKRHGAKCPVTVVPNGVSLTKFKAKSEKRKNNEYIIITTSRLVHKNGIDTLIKALTDVGHPDIKLLILGSGPDERKLKTFAKELGVTDRVEFLGHVAPEEIPGYLMNADVFVRPSRSEGLGNSFLEAMAAGVPVIGTNVGGIPDFLKDPSASSGQATGLFARVNDSKDVAQKITMLMENEALYKRLSENGRKLVQEKYSWDTIAEKMNTIFSSLGNSDTAVGVVKSMLLTTGLYPPEAGGPATYAALVERELPKRGITVNVLPFRIVRKWPPGVRHLLFFLRTLWRARGKDIVFSQDTISVGFPAMLAAKLLRKPFVIRVPGDYVWEQAVQRFGVKDGIDEFQKKKYGFRVELMRRIQKWVVRSADRVITPSDYFKKLVSGWVKDKSRVQRIYNGISFENQESRIKNQDEKIIVSAGRLVPWKGLDTLIEIMRDLPDWKLKIVGDGPESEKLKVKSEKLNVKVELVGSVPREELSQLLSEARVFVLNTSFESFSFQIVEAMHAGVPVVTTNIGNLAEIIEDGKEGILVEPNNHAQLIAAIKKMDDEAFRVPVIQNARKKAKQFSIKNTVDQLAQLLRSL